MRRLTARFIDIHLFDVHIFEDKRLSLGDVASSHVNKQRKNNILRRNCSLLTRVLRPHYMYQTIAVEIKDTIRAGEK